MIQRQHMAYSPSRRSFALATSASTIRIWSIGAFDASPASDTVNVPHVLELESGRWGLVALDFLDDQTLICAYADGVVHAWQIEADEDSALKLHVPLIGNFERLTSLSQDSHTEAASTFSLLGELSQLGKKRPEDASSVPDVGRLRTFSGHGFVVEGQGLNARQLWEWSVPHRLSCGSAWHNDGVWETLRLALATEHGDLYLLELAKGHQPKAKLLQRFGLNLSLLRFSPNGDLLAATGRRTVFILNVEQPSEKPWRTLEGLGGDLLSMCFSPTGRYLASGSIDNGIYYWDLLAKRSLRAVSQDHEGWIADLDWSEDERVLASASWDNTVGLFRSGDMAPMFCFDLHEDYASQVRFIPSSDYLISASYDRSLAVWDWRNAKLIGHLQGHQDWIHSLRWLGQNLFVSASTDRTMRIWSILDMSCHYCLSDERALAVTRVAPPEATGLSEASSSTASHAGPIYHSAGFGQQRVSGKSQEHGPADQVLKALELAASHSLADEVSMIVDDAPEAFGAMVQAATKPRAAALKRRSVRAHSEPSQPTAVTLSPLAAAQEPEHEMVFLTSLSETSSPGRVKATTPVVAFKRQGPALPQPQIPSAAIEPQAPPQPERITEGFPQDASLSEIKLPLVGGLALPSPSASWHGQPIEQELGLVEASLFDPDHSTFGFGRAGAAPRMLLEQSSEVSIQLGDEAQASFAARDHWSEIALTTAPQPPRPTLADEAEADAQPPQRRETEEVVTPSADAALPESDDELLLDGKLSHDALNVVEPSSPLQASAAELKASAVHAAPIDEVGVEVAPTPSSLNNELLNEALLKELELLELSVQEALSAPMALSSASPVLAEEPANDGPLSWSSLAEPSAQEISSDELHAPLTHEPARPPLLNFSFESEAQELLVPIPADVLSTAEQDKVERQNVQMLSAASDDEFEQIKQHSEVSSSAVSQPESIAPVTKPQLDFSMSFDSEAEAPPEPELLDIEMEPIEGSEILEPVQAPPPLPAPIERPEMKTSPLGMAAFHNDDQTKEFNRAELKALFEPRVPPVTLPAPTPEPLLEPEPLFSDPALAAPSIATRGPLNPLSAISEPMRSSPEEDEEPPVVGDVTRSGWMNHPNEDLAASAMSANASPIVQEITQDNMPVMQAIVHEERTRPEDLGMHANPHHKPAATLMLWADSPMDQTAEQVEVPPLTETFELTVAEVWQMRIAERKAAMKIFKRRGSHPSTFRSWKAFTSGHKDIQWLSFCPTTKLFLVCGEGPFIELWHPKQGRLTCLELPAPATCALMTPDGRSLIAGDRRGCVHIWLLPPEIEQLGRSALGKAVLKGHKSQISALDIDAHGRTIFSASTDGAVRVWDLKDGLCSAVLMHQFGEVCALSYDGSQTISASSDGMLRYWNEGGVLHGVVGGVGLISKLLHTRKNLIARSEDGLLNLYDEQRQPQPLTLPRTIKDIALSQEGLLVAAAESGEVFIVPELKAEPTQTLSTGQRLRAVCTDGALIVAATDQGQLELFQRA